MNDDLFSALDDAILVQSDDEDGEQYRDRLLANVAKADARRRKAGERQRSALVAANLYRVRLGLALLDAAPKTGIRQWQHREAARLGLKRRSLAYIISAARLVREARGWALEVPTSILDRDLKKIPAAIKAIAEGRDPDEKPDRLQPTPEQLAAQLEGRMARLLTDAGSLPESHGQRLAERLQDALSEFGGSGWTDGPVDRQVAPVVPIRARKQPPPLMAYPGGKHRRAPEIVGLLRPHLGPSVEYREPFAGGASVALHLLSEGVVDRVWINDIAPGVAALWTAVVQAPESLKKRVRCIKPTRDIIRRYKQWMEDDQLEGVDLALAALVVQVCSHSSYGKRAGGLLKDVAAKWEPDTRCARIEACHRLLRGRVREDRCTDLDAVEVIQEPGPAVLYVDPPYVGRGEIVYPHGFAEDDHRRLADALRGCGDPWVLSYDDADLVRELYGAWAEIEEVEVGYVGTRGQRVDQVSATELVIRPLAIPSGRRASR